MDSPTCRLPLLGKCCCQFEPSQAKVSGIYPVPQFCPPAGKCGTDFTFGVFLILPKHFSELHYNSTNVCCVDSVHHLANPSRAAVQCPVLVLLVTLVTLVSLATLVTLGHYCYLCQCGMSSAAPSWNIWTISCTFPGEQRIILRPAQNQNFSENNLEGEQTVCMVQKHPGTGYLSSRLKGESLERIGTSQVGLSRAD